MPQPDAIAVVDVQPATAERWPDLEALFGERGADAGCWCMFWRIEHALYREQTTADHKAALKELVEGGQVPGLLLYGDGQVVGWCAIGPREHFLALERSRVYKRVDAQPVWSIVCFFVAKPFRRKGIMRQLLAGALAYAQQQGATIVEGYPRDFSGPQSSANGYRGIASTFRQAGFVEVARASATQVTMRYTFS